jgi:hypothetical protein
LAQSATGGQNRSFDIPAQIVDNSQECPASLCRQLCTIRQPHEKTKLVRLRNAFFCSLSGIMRYRTNHTHTDRADDSNG